MAASFRDSSYDYFYLWLLSTRSKRPNYRTPRLSHGFSLSLSLSCFSSSNEEHSASDQNPHQKCGYDETCRECNQRQFELSRRNSHPDRNTQHAASPLQCLRVRSQPDFEMEKARTRPIITITTYSSSNSQLTRQSGAGKQSNGRPEDESRATSSESSTNFFRNTKRFGESHKSQTAPRNPLRADLSQIKGPTGSVRGHKDVVRRSLEGIKVTYRNGHSQLSSSSGALNSSSLLSFSSFFANQLSIKDESSFASNHSQSSSSSLLKLSNEIFFSEYLTQLVEGEQNLCVAYTTTLGVIRRTFEDSKILKSILNLNLVKFEERDIYLNQEYKFQLRIRTGGSISVPALFVDGKHIGGTSELETMNENGQLQVLFAKFKMSKAQSEICSCCGNARFIACQSCNGSRRSTIHHFKFNSIALRCIKCDKNDGLIQCPMCCNGTSQIAAGLGELTAVEEDSNLGALEDDQVGGGHKSEVDMNNN